MAIRDSAFCGSVEFVDDQAVDFDHLLEGFDLFQSVLSGGGVQAEQGVVRRFGYYFFYDFNDFAEFIHQAGFVLQTAGGVNKYNVIILAKGFLQSVKTQAGGITSGSALDDADVVALSPNRKLFDGCGAESVGGNEGNLFSSKSGSEFSDCGGFAGAVNADHQNDAGAAFNCKILFARF